MEIKKGWRGLEPWLAGLASSVLVMGVTCGLIRFSFVTNTAYGWTVFLIVPTILGFVAVLLGRHEPSRPFRKSVSPGWWSLLFASVELLVWKFEGVVCLLMAAPLAIPLGIFGAWIGYEFRKQIHEWRNRSISAIIAVGFIPLLLSEEAIHPLTVHRHVESTSIIIDAPPEKVWKFVGSISKLPPPKEWLFRVGIAYPIEVLLEAPKLGAGRVCRLSTGDMSERVVEWERGKRLAFSVLHTPESMKESNPFGEIHPAHLSDTFVCERGEFDLKPFPGGRTLLTGTSWYSSSISPDAYWVLWTDSIVEAVHNRVMNEIKRRAETQ